MGEQETDQFSVRYRVRLMAEEKMADLVQDDVLLMEEAGRLLIEDVVRAGRWHPQAMGTCPSRDGR